MWIVCRDLEFRTPTWRIIDTDELRLVRPIPITFRGHTVVQRGVDRHEGTEIIHTTAETLRTHPADNEMIANQ